MSILRKLSLDGSSSRDRNRHSPAELSPPESQRPNPILDGSAHDTSTSSSRTLQSTSSTQHASELNDGDLFLQNLDRFAPVINPPELSSSSFEQTFLEVAVRRRLGRNTLNEFLSVFRKYDIGNFPKDARTCLRTLRKVQSVQICGGKYFHFGLSLGLNVTLKYIRLDTDSIKIQINVDGLPLSKSSSLCFWPILCKAVTTNYVSPVFLVGLFCGSNKPKPVQNFLHFFINDVRSAIDEGITISGKVYRVSIHSVVCDAPARQFLKCIIGHNGYFACERCEVEGTSCRIPNVLSHGVRLNRTKCRLRTDASFRERRNEPHHISGTTSPFCEVPGLDMVFDFPLDYMHLILLGVVRRLLKLWFGYVKVVKGKKSESFKLNKTQIVTLNDRQIRFTRSVPSDFQRKPRLFTYLKLFKATEYRTFLCYSAPYVLKDVFRCQVVYDHFMCLVVSIRLFCTPNLPPISIRYARKCLKLFVEHFRYVYGAYNIVYNVHSAFHLHQDYDRFGCLDSISSFPYESYMQTLKSYVKRPGNELEQVVKRLHESLNFQIPPVQVPEISAELKGRHFNGPLGPDIRDDHNAIQFSEVFFKGRFFMLDSPNCFVYCKRRYCQVVNILKVNQHVVFVVQPFESISDVFTSPCRSSKLGIVFVRQPKDRVLLNVHISRAAKCWCVECHDGKLYVVRLLHESL